MTKENDNNQNPWNNPQVRLQIAPIVKEFGKPALDIKTDPGIVLWRNVGIFDGLFLEDVLSVHKIPKKHCDSLIGGFTVFIKPEFISALCSIDTSIGYQRPRFLLTIQCKNTRWITAIAYVCFRYLDSLEFPEKTGAFSIEKAKYVVKTLLNQIDENDDLYFKIQRKIKKYKNRNLKKYSELIFEKCNKRN